MLLAARYDDHSLAEKAERVYAIRSIRYRILFLKQHSVKRNGMDLTQKKLYYDNIQDRKLA